MNSRGNYEDVKNIFSKDRRLNILFIHLKNFMPNINPIYYLIADGLFGTLALKTGIPGTPLAGALIGASILSISGKVNIAEWPNGTRTLLEVGIGKVL